MWWPLLILNLVHKVIVQDPYVVGADFTSEMIELYEKRLENGYDIYTDASYVAWLEEFHPEHVPRLGKLLIF